MKKSVWQGIIASIILVFIFSACNTTVTKYYSITYESEYGVVPETILLAESTVITEEYLPELFTEGYTFEGWYEDDSKVEAGKKILVKKTVLKAKWKKHPKAENSEITENNTESTESAKSNTTESTSETHQSAENEQKVLYTIKHYKQNLENDDFTLIENETETKSLIRINNDVDITEIGLEKTYKGFTATSQLEANNIVTIKYRRNVSTYVFNSNSGSWRNDIIEKTIKGKFGTSVSNPEAPTRIGYDFLGWSESETAVTADYTDTATFLVPADATTKTLYAVWQQKAFVNNDNNNLTFISGGGVQILAEKKFNFRAVPDIIGVYTYEWYLNNIKQKSTTEYYTIVTENLQPGYYSITVKATNSVTGMVYVTQFEQPLCIESQ